MKEVSGQVQQPVPIWFGARDRPLAGFLHLPPGPATGGVIICGPFGYEATCAHRTLRRLGDQLADAGRVALRFDYEGTGGSAGTGFEPDLLERWQHNVLAAVEEMRRRGIAQPALVGLRLGAALACTAAAADSNLGPLVLWAPVTSGRRYHRELRGQAAATAGGVLPDGSYNLFGYPVAAQSLATLKTWQPLAGLAPDRELLLVQSPGWRDAGDTTADLAAAGLNPQLLQRPGTSAMLERDAELADVPVQLVHDIRDWLTSHPAESSESSTSALAADRTRVIDTGGGLVEEELVEVGPSALFGTLTRPLDGEGRDTVLFLNNGVTPAPGPGRSWVEFGRSLALAGICSLRLDLSGLGESRDDHPAALRPNSYPRTAAAEVDTAVRYLRDRGARTVTVAGLCSGAQMAVRGAAYGERLDGVFAINPSLYNPTDIGAGPWTRKLWQLATFPASKRPILDALHRLPGGFWTVLDRIGIFPSPMRFLRRAVERGTRLNLVYSPGDRAQVDLQVRAGRAVGQLAAAGKLSIAEISNMDHSMFDRESRAVVLRTLAESLSVTVAVPLEGDPVAGRRAAGDGLVAD